MRGSLFGEGLIGFRESSGIRERDRALRTNGFSRFWMLALYFRRSSLCYTRSPKESLQETRRDSRALRSAEAGYQRFNPERSYTIRAGALIVLRWRSAFSTVKLESRRRSIAIVTSITRIGKIRPLTGSWESSLHRAAVDSSDSYTFGSADQRSLPSALRGAMGACDNRAVKA